MNYIDPDVANQLGIQNQDSNLLPEFTFHHGHVEQVINTPDDLSASNYLLSNVSSNISQLIVITSTFEGNVSANYLKNKIVCQPLLRGFSDSIATGDSVIYTKIGEVNYYLGPLNTTNNPNYTPDSFYEKKSNTVNINTDDRKFDENGYNVNYIKTQVEKNYKDKILDLDRPYGTGIGEVGSDAEIESTYSDLTLEGRHNNHITIGSRFFNPYTIIKNNSTLSNQGSVIGLLSMGSLLQNNIDYDGLSSDLVVQEAIEIGTDSYLGNFIGIGNDSTEAEGIPRQDIFNLNFAEVTDDINNQTDFDQIIIFSDRITFDATSNDLTMSAKRNLNIGTGQNISITSKKHTVIQSENIYLGVESQSKTEPIVLGEELRKILEDIVNVINSAHALVQGVPLPLVDPTGAPLRLASATANSIQSIEEIISKLVVREQDDDGVYQDGPTPFLSRHHFIETNRG